MEKITMAELKALAEQGGWQREQCHEVSGQSDRQEEKRDDKNETFAPITITTYYGYGTKTSSKSGIKITFTELLSFDEYMPDSLKTSPDEEGPTWEVEGAIVVDDDGEPLTPHEIHQFCEAELGEDFRSIDYSDLQIEQIIDIEVDSEDPSMETITIPVDNGPSIRFVGERISHVKSSPNNAHPSYSKQTGRWSELVLYKTVSGKYVCQEIGRTQWQGERDRYSAKVCDTPEEVIEFFGHRWLAKELYKDAGIEDVVTVD